MQTAGLCNRVKCVTDLGNGRERVLRWINPEHVFKQELNPTERKGQALRNQKGMGHNKVKCVTEVGNGRESALGWIDAKNKP